MKLPGLVRLLAEDDDRGEATITHIARVIREAGHLPTTKRGRGASDMGLTEAANLLIGAHATDLPAKAGEVVGTFRKLQALPYHTRTGLNIESSKWWSHLAKCQTFGDALEHLIAQNERDREEVAEAFYKYTGESTRSEYRVFRSAHFAWPNPAASVSLFIVRADDFERLSDGDLKGARIDMNFRLSEAERLFRKDEKQSSRIIEVTARDSVIRRLSEACADVSSEPLDVEVAA